MDIKERLAAYEAWARQEGFYADKRDGDELLIVSVRHDDCELSAWLPATDERPGRFEAFLAEQREIPTDDA